MSIATTVPLEALMSSGSGSLDPSRFPEEVFDLYSIPAFDQGEPEVVPGSKIGSAKQIIETGDVLLSRIVPHIRRAWVVGENRGRRIIGSGEWIVFRHASVDPHYLRHVLVGDPFHAEFMRTVSGVGGSLLRARPAYVGKIRVPLPSLAEQQRISAILDRAESLQAMRATARERLDTLIQSVFLDMFGDLGPNPMGWPSFRLGEVAQFFAGSTLPPGVDYSGQANGYFLLKVSDMNLDGNEVYLNICQQWSNAPGADAATCPQGSIVIPKRGGAIGTNKKRITSRRSVLDPNLMAIWPRPEFVELAFLYVWFLRLDLATITSGSSVPQLNKRDLDPLRVSVPDISLQREFARRLAAIENLAATYDTSLAEFEALFAALQDRAFRGEL